MHFIHFQYFICPRIRSILKIAMYVKVCFQYGNFLFNMQMLAAISGICTYFYNYVIINNRAMDKVSILLYSSWCHPCVVQTASNVVFRNRK